MIDGRTVMEVDPEGRSAAEIVHCGAMSPTGWKRISAAPCLLPLPLVSLRRWAACRARQVASAAVWPSKG
jgi:hypothetical protein